jgi:hypothetical protein
LKGTGSGSLKEEKRRHLSLISWTQCNKFATTGTYMPQARIRWILMLLLLPDPRPDPHPVFTITKSVSRYSAASGSGSRLLLNPKPILILMKTMIFLAKF